MQIGKPLRTIVVEPLEGEHRSGAHAPDSEQGYACSSVWTVCVKPTAVYGSPSRHLSFRRAVCVNAHVPICAGGDQRWSSLLRQVDMTRTSRELPPACRPSPVEGYEGRLQG